MTETFDVLAKGGVMDRVLAVAPVSRVIPAWHLPTFEIVRAPPMETLLDAFEGFDAVLLWPQQEAAFLSTAARLLQTGGGNTIPVLLAIDETTREQDIKPLAAEVDGFVDLRWPAAFVETSLRCAVRNVRLGRNVALIQQAVLAEARTQAATLYRRAVRDALTGLYNRRHFDEILPREHARAKRLGEKYALGVFDIDDLRIINTRFGHDVGSKVLCQAANLLQSGVRLSDYAFRYGGDEFVVLLPRADSHEALIVAEHIVGRIGSNPFVCDGKEIPCGLSAGVAAYNGGNETVEDVFRRADAALVHVKQSAKGRVVAYENISRNPLVSVIAREGTGR
ncbi:MAG: GGDEF domain-containing protein [Bdellovibrionota bacterium]